VGSDAAAPVEGEVRAVAELLAHRPDQLTAIKLPGPGRIGESVLTAMGMPELHGFSPPEHIEVAWDGETGVADELAPVWGVKTRCAPREIADLQAGR
jgi:hypothetical protein